MEKNDLNKRRNQAQRFFSFVYPDQNPEVVEDFGSYCIEKWLTGRSLKTQFRYLAVDFLREYGMKLEGKRGNTDASGQLSTEFVDSNFKDDIKYSYYFEHKSDLLRNKKLTKEERAMLILYFEWELDLKEIGDVLGVTESAVSQTLKKILSDLKKRLSLLK